jgi:serine phosphatase RsbU (regulator of sigma subunit)
MPPVGDHPHASGGRPTLPSTAAGRQLGQLVRDRLASDPGWRTFTIDQKRWVCPWCLSAVSRRHQRSWEDSIGAHLEGCKHYGNGRFQPQASTSVQAQLSFENMVGRAESDAAWQVFDSQGMWVCPACLDRVPDARLVANQRNTLTFRGMALHLQRCAAYGGGILNAAPVVRAAKDRPPGGGNTRATSALNMPVRTPSNGAPAQLGRTPTQAMTPPRPGGNIPVATPMRGAPIAAPLTAPVSRPTAPLVLQPTTLPPVAAPPPASLPPTAGPTTGSHLRMRRFITPAPDAVEAAAPPAQAGTEEAGFNWMDAADAEAGAVTAQPEVPHVERSDLMRARDLQQKFLAEAPDVPGFTFATRYEPCDHVSGDFFSFIRLLDGRIGFAIGDVSGHGMQAGLVMSMAKKTLEIYGELIGDPGEVLAKVNDALAGDLGGKMFISMTYAILSPSDRTISWARAGHNPTLLINASTREISEIRPPGMVVGMKGGQVFRDSLQVETTHLNPGDTFLLYTDGVTEMTNAQGEEFEMDRLRAVLERHSNEGPDALLTQVMDRIRHFRGTKPVGDDVTLLALAVAS